MPRRLRPLSFPIDYASAVRKNVRRNGSDQFAVDEILLVVRTYHTVLTVGT